MTSFSRERSQSVSTISSSSSVYSKNVFTGTLRRLKNTLITVDSSTVQGRLVQRLRLVGIQLIPVVVFLAICIQQLITYNEILKTYTKTYEKENVRFSIVNFIFKLDKERSISAYELYKVKAQNQKYVC